MTIGQTRLPCSTLTEIPTEAWHDLHSPKGELAGSVRVGVSFSQEVARPAKGWQNATSIGGFSQPSKTSAMSIGGFSQPQTSSHTIGGFQQPSTQAPVHAIRGFTTVSTHSTGGSAQQQNLFHGLHTTATTPANSGGALGNTVQPNVCVRGPYVPQTDTHHGGRALNAPVMATPQNQYYEQDTPQQAAAVSYVVTPTS